jgi:thioredoxin reductase (NADPH)
MSPATPVPERSTRAPIIDCVVVGGGPAGLAAAIQLGRLRRSCVVVDDNAGRSLWSQVTRNHLGFPDGVTAADLRLLGQRQAVAYGATLRDGEVTGLRRAAGRAAGFVVTIAATDEAEPDDETPGMAENRARERRHGARLGERRTRQRVRLHARTVLLATGVVDAFPTFAGRDECVGISLFWCIVCDGYESIGRHVAVVGDDAEAIGTAFGLRHFTDRVTLVTGRRTSLAAAERLEALRERGVTVIEGTVTAYRHDSGRIRSLKVGRTGHGRGHGPTSVDCEMVFVSTPKRPRTELAHRLGARADEAGYVVTDDAGRTTVMGLYAAGDATAGHSHQVTAAAHLGATTATAINYDLYDPVERDET